MKTLFAPLLAALVVAAAGTATPVFAQNAAPAVALPTAPGAHKAVEGGPSQAPASLPGPGESPLEPYLVTWLLPISGLIVAGVFVLVDKRVRLRHGRL
ncbi:MAG: hypothetical protein NVSMB21_24780 [Vulcanimicrobiaceae bacterium]